MVSFRSARLVEDGAVGTKVFDAQGITRIVAVKSNGVKSVLRVHTKDGTKLDVTPDHLVWRTRRAGKSGWAEAERLRPGDRLHWHGFDTLGDALVHNGEIRVLEIARVQVVGALPVYDIQTESGEYLSEHVRVHNCFILSVDDTMDDILNWYREEGIIFKGGSGAGMNLSRIRSSRELLNGRRYRVGAGELHARRRRVGGHDQVGRQDAPGGEDGHSRRRPPRHRGLHLVQGRRGAQGTRARRRRLRHGPRRRATATRSSTRTRTTRCASTDEFMQAVIDDRDWTLQAVTDGQPVKTMQARDLMRQIGQSAWECADPGMQFDTTINRWHTASNTGRINASNPC